MLLILENQYTIKNMAKELIAHIMRVDKGNTHN